MSDTALMMFKPEFLPEDRERFLPLVREYLNDYGLVITSDCEVIARDQKAILFDRVYSRLLQNARKPFIENMVGGYAYLEATPELTEKQLFDEWVSPHNPALREGEDNYYLMKDDVRVVNPFCPYQRKRFIESPVSVRLFLVRKSTPLPWERIKPLFQGDPVQNDGNGTGVRGHLSGCSWYTPTTNGLHLSASEIDAERETREVMDFFKDRR
ncbi:hypothetical protein ACQV2C_12180 [Pantoea allii]|uniref:hypothetical protein n=1 Tax=Pantoea allii TaxID=574096 RepID=UPI003D311B77